MIYSKDQKKKNKWRNFSDWDEKDQDEWMSKRGLPKEAKYEDYQLAGEKDNYKEIMIVLPREGSMKKVGDYTVPSAHKYGEDLADNRGVVHLRMNTRTDADGNKVLFLEEVQSDWGQKGKKEGFDGKKAIMKLKKVIYMMAPIVTGKQIGRAHV